MFTQNDYQDLLKKFSISSFDDEMMAMAYFKLVGLHRTTLAGGRHSEAWPPILRDLARLHFLILKNKAVTVLELGSGFSSLVIAHALATLDALFGDYVREISRAEKPFHLFSVDESYSFSNIAKNRVPSSLLPYVTFSSSSVSLHEHLGKIHTKYDELPNVVPDFVYIDGPGLKACNSKISGFGLNSSDKKPMAGDLLAIEFQLEPGCFILLDGRTANARFLKACLLQNWQYQHHLEADVHTLELVEDPLGPLNAKMLQFKNVDFWRDN